MEYGSPQPGAETRLANGPALRIGGTRFAKPIPSVAPWTVPPFVEDFIDDRALHMSMARLRTSPCREKIDGSARANGQLAFRGSQCELVPVIHMRARQNGCSLAQALAIH